MGVKLIIMGWQYTNKVIYCKYINNKVVIKAVVKGDGDKDEEDNLFNIQTKYSSRIKGGIYKRSITELSFSTKS